MLVKSERGLLIYDHASLKPGDTIDGTTLRSGTFDPNIPPIDAFCQPPINRAAPKPGTYPVTCRVATLPVLDIGPGWVARTQQILDDNWSAITLESYLDGHKIDLQAFGTLDADLQLPEGPAKLRFHPVHLYNLQGTHTYRGVLRLSREINDGFVTSPPGTYEFVITFTVSPASAAGQPPLPSTGEAPAPATLLLTVGSALLLVGLVLRRRCLPSVT